MNKDKLIELRNKIDKLRNSLYDELPSGDVYSWQFIKIIKLHLKKLDDLSHSIDLDIAAIKQEPEISANNITIRDLTDEEWLKLPKEEILQLYKNCYKMLNDFIRDKQEQNVPSNQELEQEAKRILHEHTYFEGYNQTERISLPEAIKAMQEYRKLPLRKDEECYWFDECQGRNKCTKPR